MDEERSSRLVRLRSLYPTFVYEAFAWREDEGGTLDCSFRFRVGDLVFDPTCTLTFVSPRERVRIAPAVMDNLVFHLGLAELPSYWKATCSPHIDVRAGTEHAVAATNEPPECNDKASLRDAKRQYQGLEEQKQNLKIKEFSDVKQIRLGPPPASVNQYANKTTYATSSRWCQATAALSNGKTDTIYWRMDYLVEGKGFSINFDHCATNHDLLDSNCQKLRAGK